jgi:dynein heavy chain, axonemal
MLIDCTDGLASAQLPLHCRSLTHPLMQVEDLAVASPATVSRCGMVYMEPTALGMEPLLASWLQRLPALVQPHASKLRAIFEGVVPECARFVKKALKETVATVPHNLVSSCFNIMDSLIKPYAARSEGKPYR